MNLKKFLFSLLIISVSLSVSGCIKINSGSSSKKVDGGIYKSLNRGEAFAQKGLIPTITGKPASIASLDADVLALDP